MIDLGDVISGTKAYKYVVGRDYDWTYRLCHIKAVADYSEFYVMCPLRGPTFAGNTLKEAVAFIDVEHATEGAHMPGEGPELPENVYRFPF